VDGTRRYRITRRTVGLVLTGLLTVGAAACGSNDGDDSVDGVERQPTTTAEATSTTTAPEDVTTTSEGSSVVVDESGSVEDQIIARYIAFWDARFAANSPPDPDDPDLAEYACCEQLDQVRTETEGHQDSNLEFRLPDDPLDRRWVEVVAIEGDEATVQECVVVDTVVVESGSGDVVSDSVTTYNVRGEMRLVVGAWRLAAAVEVQSWEGAAGCIDAR
jgi:hypothetical protein